MEIFGKAIREYLWPIRYYVIASLVVVVSQYYIALPLSAQYPFVLNVTQALWALFVALSVVKLVKNCSFNMKNVLFLGVLYSFIIHGTKAFFFRVFLFPYSGTFEEIAEKIIWKFVYGSFLVFAIVVIIGIVFIYSKKKGLL
ncbi:MAG: hypothetical protein V1900_03635 [Candidatus Aenigmatarchaeota archaeon]